ncbi:GDSL-type esterase/lipase family protein [Ohessyouella blattaphilus]|uniref:GDSL-type esterase/lipase family protein n=1 Tax=Ohessyouella blattaphilus TaxID=2949333 RepID=A0ABT1EI54_9FIRM|nr:GDSL-type esterase/lipase family protein [Ohessyouella blattaphilus]MCP1110381.1 GDSL-type esterase/lipase family protein [Ohessyouella blattaphilus]MCR8563775.1 GDSL-type esterase/lipase family protein [Ohessyouella blattaphilus]
MKNKMKKKRVLCFGDSNTWGYIPGSGERYLEDERYPGILQATLGEEYRVVEEGLNGRTTVFADLIEPQRCGIEQVLPILLSHAPLDFLIIMLGTNDTKIRFMVNATVISYGMEEMLVRALDIIRNTEQRTKVILAAPVPLGKVEDSMFDQESVVKSQELARHYLELSKKYKCVFFDAGEVVRELGSDGIHLDLEGHKRIGTALAAVIKKMKEREE